MKLASKGHPNSSERDNKRLVSMKELYNASRNGLKLNRFKRKHVVQTASVGVSGGRRHDGDLDVANDENGVSCMFELNRGRKRRKCGKERRFA